MIELDKYRVLALMGLPFAQELSRTVDALNEELMRVMDAIGDAEKPSAEAPNPNLRRELLAAHRARVDGAEAERRRARPLRGVGGVRGARQRPRPLLDHG